MSGSARFRDKVVVVTGAGGGIGRAEALLFAEEGAAVIVNDIRDGVGVGSAHGVADEIVSCGGVAVANTDSVASFSGARAIMNTALDNFGRLDVLVNNAGNYDAESVERMTEEQWDAVLRVHLTGSFATTKFAVPVFKRQRAGVILNTSSEAGLGRPGNTNYASAKEGLIGLTRSLARELGRFGVRCNAIRPRVIDTSMVLAAQHRAAHLKPLMDALGRYSLGEMAHTVQPDASSAAKVAPLVAWLCSDSAHNVNGRTFFVGGDEIGVYSEPSLDCSLIRPGGWDLDALDAFAPSHLTIDLVNRFLAPEIGDQELVRHGASETALSAFPR